MKKYFFVAVLAASCISLSAQTNYTGAYGYSSPPVKNEHNNGDSEGPSGSLILQKMDGNKYRFWLDVNIGAPSYNMGETDGTISLVNDTASFDNTYDGALNACLLHFKVAAGAVVISTSANSFDCGFGNRVNAAGTYKKSAKQPPIDNAFLKRQYHEALSMSVRSATVEVYQDENASRPFDKRQRLTKGQTILVVAENETTAYTEFFDSNGKFIYGWVKKAELE